MLRSLCRRSRRCEYYWTIILLVILVFLYTCLYNVYVGSDSQADVSYVTAVNRDPRRDQNSKDAISSSSTEKATVKKIFSEDISVRTSRESVASSATTTTIITGSSNPVAEHKVINKIEDKAVTEKDDPIMKMRELVDKMNKDEVVLNEDKFPSFDLVMIVQVHRRTEYLKMLVESLRNARDISKVLLVVSFDYYDEELFSVVDKIDICKVIILLFLVGWKINVYCQPCGCLHSPKHFCIFPKHFCIFQQSITGYESVAWPVLY